MIAHSSFCNESVVISYGIVAAKIQNNFQPPNKFKKNDRKYTENHQKYTPGHCRRTKRRVRCYCRCKDTNFKANHNLSVPVVVRV